MIYVCVSTENIYSYVDITLLYFYLAVHQRNEFKSEIFTFMRYINYNFPMTLLSLDSEKKKNQDMINKIF